MRPAPEKRATRRSTLIACHIPRSLSAIRRLTIKGHLWVGEASAYAQRLLGKTE
jgi:hypothetical protein